MPTKSGNESQPKGADSKLIAAALVAVVVLVIGGIIVFSQGSATGLFGLGKKAEANPTDPGQYLSRQVYFREAFTPDRSNYHIFEAASQFSGKPLGAMPAYFNVKDEADIFSNLPPIADDFSDIAFLLASGKYFALNGLSENYWKQPEFYPNFKEGGLRWWKQPDPKSWATNGYGTYPAEQWTTLTKGDTESFEATFFIYSGFGVQTYQGVSLFVNPEANKYFDISITPDTFLLEPNFPQFGKEWAKKIVVRGTLKPGVKKGDYLVALNVGVPPQTMVAEWESQYRNLYMSAASSVKPAGNTVDLHVKVQ